jgi:hypothetical protein
MHENQYHTTKNRGHVGSYLAIDEMRLISLLDEAENWAIVQAPQPI